MQASGGNVKRERAGESQGGWLSGEIPEERILDVAAG
jgi:hypothetical protein